MALLEFYGKECSHCKDMSPLVERLKKEGFEIEQYETWHNEEHAKKQQKYDKGLCGGVPFFMNTDSGKWICGATDYVSLKKWAEGKE
jgi:thiol-disulfide isomerase/thioredoxin